MYHLFKIVAAALRKPRLPWFIASPFVVLIFTVKIKSHTENATRI